MPLACPQNSMALDIQLVSALGDVMEAAPITQSEFDELLNLVQETRGLVLMVRIKDYYEDAGWKREELPSLSAEIEKLISRADASKRLMARKVLRTLRKVVERAVSDEMLRIRLLAD